MIDKYEDRMEQLVIENEKLRQYKKSKQASYETMQIEWNKAVNELRDAKSQLNLEIQRREIAEKAKDEYYLNNLNYEIRLSELTQALEEVRNYVLDNSDFDKSDSLQSPSGAYDILKIVEEVLKLN